MTGRKNSVHPFTNIKGVGLKKLSPTLLTRLISYL